MQADADENCAQFAGDAQVDAYEQQAPVSGFLANVATFMQLAPVATCGSGQVGSVHPVPVHVQVFASVHEQLLQASLA